MNENADDVADEYRLPQMTSYNEEKPDFTRANTLW